METVGNQAYTQNQLNYDGCPCHQKAEIEAEKMIAVNVNLELVHVEQFHNGRKDKNQSEKHFQCNG